MKKIFLFILVTIAIGVYGQNFKITYKVDVKFDVQKFDKVKKEAEAGVLGGSYKLKLLQGLQKSLKILDTLRYELVFNKKESIFKKQKDVNLKGNDKKFGDMLKNIIISQDSMNYKNKFQKYSLRKSMEDKWLIRINYPNNYYDWKLVNKTKKILGYLCKLAVATYDVNLGDRVVHKTVYAWFTEELPYPYGPNGFDNLPGVILESNVKNVTFKAEKIIKNVIFPKIPKAKEIFSIVEYEKEQEKLYKHLINMKRSMR